MDRFEGVAVGDHVTASNVDGVTVSGRIVEMSLVGMWVEFPGDLVVYHSDGWEIKK